MPQTYLRYGVVRIADKTDDQKPAAAIVNALVTSVTQEDLQEFVLSQIKRIIWGNNPGHWYTDFESIAVKSLSELSATAGFRSIGVLLIGPRNGVNRVFTTPVKFRHVPGSETIEVFHNGRRLVQGSADPRSSEYFISESGGLGTGFDTVSLVSFSPSSSAVLVANYLPTV